jgi:DUF917 family protein
MWFLVVIGMCHGSPVYFRERYPTNYECQRVLENVRRNAKIRIEEIYCSWEKEGADGKGSPVQSNCG